jgi:hypothetical protein
MATSSARLRVATPALIAISLTAVILSPLLVGVEPIGGDPDRIYRPIKAELASALVRGELPYWTERFGLGIPLVAESHAATFYPPNQILYRAFDVSVAYRLAMWGHNLLLVVTTFAYACRLGLSRWGSALASLAFTFCGMQAIHSSHEWMYHVLPYLPLALLLVDRYDEDGRLLWVGLLGLVLGVQWTLGHFQLQTWTNGLVLWTGLWRIVADRRSWFRLIGLIAAIGLGGAIACVQLGPSWELARFVGQTARSPAELVFYSFPPAHWAELAIPRLFRGLRGGPEDPYWFFQQTTGFEACLYVGTLPFILAVIGLVSVFSNKRLAPWVLLAPASFALATMPRWWPAGYLVLLQIPGLGYFRCPARFTLVTSLGIAILAGYGFDRAIASRRFWLGFGLALIAGGLAFAWAAVWTMQPGFAPSFRGEPLEMRLGPAALVWLVAVVLVVAWRRGQMPAAVILVATALELGFLYYTTTTDWGVAVPLPASSPTLERLVREPNVGRVGGSTDNLPVRAGLTTGTPYAGFTLPAPNPLLAQVGDRRALGSALDARWRRRLGMTHMIWDEPIGMVIGGELVFRGPDAALDRLTYRPAGAPARRTWSVLRLADPFPAAFAATRVYQVQDRATLLNALSRTDALDEAWFLPADAPQDNGAPRASHAHVQSWDGRVGVVDHDGTCDLVLVRTYYPGWSARVNDGAEQPVHSVNGGLQAVRLNGVGPSRVTLRYRPTALAKEAAVSFAALVAAMGLVAAGLRRRPVPK